MNVSLIWITRIDDQEDRYLEEYLDNLKDIDVEIVIIGHTQINQDNIRYVPFYEHGIDSLGLICHKKNIGVLAASRNVCVVMHADIAPTRDTLVNYRWDNIKDGDIVCPVATTPEGQVGYTWCRKFSTPKPALEPFDANSYISGACLIATKQTLLDNKWDQNLRHNECEDVEMSDRLFAAKKNVYCDPQLQFNIKTIQ